MSEICPKGHAEAPDLVVAVDTLVAGDPEEDAEQDEEEDTEDNGYSE